jgi:hypothetical protein
MYRGQLLDDAKSIASHDIEKEVTLQIVARPKAELSRQLNESSSNDLPPPSIPAGGCVMFER